MYLLERPQYSNGIYAIFNIITKQAYIGQSVNLPFRTKQHIEAILQKNEDIKKQIKKLKRNKKSTQDNIKLLMEERKEFVHFVIEFDDEIDSKTAVERGENDKSDRIYDADEKVDLDGYEKLFIRIVKDMNFGLYNINFANITDEEIEQQHSFVYTQKEEMRRLLTDKLTEVFCKHPSEILSMEKTEAEAHWKYIVDKYKQKAADEINYFVLDSLDNEESKISFDKAVYVLKTFWFSKTNANAMDIVWNDSNTLSIFDEKLNFKDGVIIAKLGPHNCEPPYEILQRMSMNINTLGYSFWAFRRLCGTKICEKVAANQELYIIFLTTPSEQKAEAQKNKTNIYEKITREKVNDKNQRIKDRNTTVDLYSVMHAYYNEDADDNGKWEQINPQHLYVTIPASKEIAKSFIIEKLWFCKEAFNVSGLFECFNTFPDRRKEEAKNTFRGQTTFIYAEQKEEKELSDCIDVLRSPNSENTNCLIAKLKAPFVTQISHAPILSEYIEEHQTPVIMFAGGKPMVKKKLSKILVFTQDNVVKIVDVVNTYGEVAEFSYDEIIEFVNKKCEGETTRYYIEGNKLNIFNESNGEVVLKYELSKQLNFYGVGARYKMDDNIYEKCWFYGSADSKSGDILSVMLKGFSRKPEEPPFILCD